MTDDTLSKIKNFVNYVRDTLSGYEKGEAQVFCDRLFQAFGHKGCIEAGAKLEYRLKSPGKHTKFPDLVWRPWLLLEMKSRGEKLEEHHQQVFEYWDKLIPQTRYVVLCNFDELWIYDTTIQIEEPINRVKLEELPERYNALNFLFPGNSAVDNYWGNYYENIHPSGVVQLFGREKELERLHQLLTSHDLEPKEGEQQDKLEIAAIVGMGGIGKTELAIQYAWHYLKGLDNSTGGVCWVDSRAGDVGIQLVNFARSLLNLNPPEDWDLPTKLRYCWRNWQKGNWLIVIDDVTNYRQQVKPYLPPESSKFKVLLTAREEFGQPVKHLPLDKLQPEAALDLLKSLVGVQRIQQELDIAKQICRQFLDYLPLGLELVGRYLERDSDLSLKTMLSRLEKKRLRHKSVLEADATMTAKLGVADAFELSWERLNEDAQFLGCLLSLFASADIPWDLVKLAYSNMFLPENEEIDLDFLEEARADLLRFYLLQRTGEGSYLLHQLIREFLREKREESAQVNDFKQGFIAAIVAVAKQVPQSPTLEQIQELAPAIPHVAEVVKDHDLRDLLNNEDLTEPFSSLGSFYIGRGLYDQAEPWFEQCLSVTQARFGLDHPNVAASLTNLAFIYFSQGRYSKAKPLLLQALELNKRLLGEEGHEVATCLNNLAELYRHQGCYSKAEPLYVQGLEMRKLLLEEKHPHVAHSLSNLASLYYFQNRYAEAEPLLVQALELQKCSLGEEHLDIAQSLNSLGSLYKAQGRFTKAKPLLLQALELRRRLLGEDHPDVARSLNSLGSLYNDQGRFTKAKPLLLQALELRRRLLGEDHPDVAQSLNSLALFYHAQGCLSEAEPLYVQSLEFQKRLMGEDHPDVAIGLSNLALLYETQGHFSKAEHLYVQALEIFQQRLGLEHSHTVICQKNLTKLRDRLNSTATDLPNFNQRLKKGSSKKKPKGFGSV